MVPLQEGRHGRGGDPAPDVAASMRQFIETLTTPETDLEHKVWHDCVIAQL
jgi:endo-beta-N-acetylglucosaminidase D